MRVRLLGQFVPASLALLALIEAVLAFLALYAAASIRFDVGMSELPALEQQYGPLWPRGVAFSVIVVGCLLAFGLYNSRQRVQLSGILARVAGGAGRVGMRDCGALLCRAEPAPGARCRGPRRAAGVVRRDGLAPGVCPRRRRGDLQAPRARVRGRVHRDRLAQSAPLGDRRGFALAGFVQPPGEPAPLPLSGCSTPQGGLPDLCGASASRRSWWRWTTGAAAFRSAELLDCRLAGVDVTELLTFLERETGRVRVDVLNPELADLRPGVSARSRCAFFPPVRSIYWRASASS